MSCPSTPSGVIAAHLESIANAVDETVAMNSFDRNKSWVLSKVLPTVDHSGGIVPDMFYHPNVFIWLPHIIRESLQIRCPRCCDSKSVVEKGWTSRRVIDTDSSMFVLAKQYQCGQCSASKDARLPSLFASCDASVLMDLPSDLQAAFPAVMTAPNATYGMSRQLAHLVQSCATMNLSSDQVHAMITDMQMQRYHARKAAFETSAAHSIQTGNDEQLSDDQLRYFSAFDDQDGYAGFVPSISHIEALIRSHTKRWPSVPATVVKATESPSKRVLSISTELAQGLNSVCGDTKCPGFINCIPCQTIQAKTATPVDMIRAFCTTPKGVKDSLELDLSSPVNAVVSAEMSSLSSPMSCTNSDMKRKRRPRRCQNRQVINGCVVVCNLSDCAGRGGQKFCTRFKSIAGHIIDDAFSVPATPCRVLDNVPGQQIEGDALTALATFVRGPTSRESEILAMEALSNM